MGETPETGHNYCTYTRIHRRRIKRFSAIRTLLSKDRCSHASSSLRFFRILQCVSSIEQNIGLTTLVQETGL